MPKSFFGAVALRERFKPTHKAQEYEEHCQCNDQKIALERFAAQYIYDLADQQQIVQAERRDGIAPYCRE